MKKFYQLSGNYNYHVEIEVKGQLPYQNSSITILAYTSEKKERQIQISVYWQKIRENKTIANLSENMQNTYSVEGVDVGERIVGNINSQEESYKGVCKLTLDPIEIEPALRVNLFQAVNANFLKFDIKLIQSPGKLALNTDSLTLIDFKIKKQLKIKYYYNWPILLVSAQHPKLIGLLYSQQNTQKNCIRTQDLQDLYNFSNEYKQTNPIQPLNQSQCSLNDHVIWVEMASKYTKDLFILGLKTFNFKNQLLLQKIVSCNYQEGNQNVEFNNYTNNTNNRTSNSDDLNHNYNNSIFKSLKSLFANSERKEDTSVNEAVLNETTMENYYQDLNQLAQNNKYLQQDKMRLEKEKVEANLKLQQLEAQIQANKNNSNSSNSNNNMNSQEMNQKYNEIQRQNQLLKQTIQQIKDANPNSTLILNNQNSHKNYNHTLNNISQILHQVDQETNSNINNKNNFNQQANNNTINNFKNIYEVQQKELLLQEKDKEIMNLQSQIQQMNNQLDMYKKSLEILKGTSQESSCNNNNQINQLNYQLQQLAGENKSLKNQINTLKIQQTQLVSNSQIIQQSQNIQNNGKNFDENYYVKKLEILTQENKSLVKEKEKLQQLIQTYVNQDASQSELHYTQYLQQ